MRRLARTYPQAHRWLRGVIASISGVQHSVFGWQRLVPEGFNRRFWPCQTMGFEIPMLVTILLTEAGMEVCASAHDDLIKGPIDQIEAIVEQACTIMRDLAKMVTGGFPIDVDRKVYPHGESYIDKRGREMWERRMSLLDREEDGSRVEAA